MNLQVLILHGQGHKNCATFAPHKYYKFSEITAKNCRNYCVRLKCTYGPFMRDYLTHKQYRVIATSHSPLDGFPTQKVAAFLAWIHPTDAKISSLFFLNPKTRVLTHNSANIANDTV